MANERSLIYSFPQLPLNSYTSHVVDDSLLCTRHPSVFAARSVMKVDMNVRASDTDLLQHWIYISKRQPNEDLGGLWVFLIQIWECT